MTIKELLVLESTEDAIKASDRIDVAEAEKLLFICRDVAGELVKKKKFQEAARISFRAQFISEALQAKNGRVFKYK